MFYHKLFAHFNTMHMFWFLSLSCSLAAIFCLFPSAPLILHGTAALRFPSRENVCTQAGCVHECEELYMLLFLCKHGSFRMCVLCVYMHVCLQSTELSWVHLRGFQDHYSSFFTPNRLRCTYAHTATYCLKLLVLKLLQCVCVFWCVYGWLRRESPRLGPPPIHQFDPFLNRQHIAWDAKTRPGISISSDYVVSHALT